MAKFRRIVINAYLCIQEAKSPRNILHYLSCHSYTIKKIVIALVKKVRIYALQKIGSIESFPYYWDIVRPIKFIIGKKRNIDIRFWVAKSPRIAITSYLCIQEANSHRNILHYPSCHFHTVKKIIIALLKRVGISAYYALQEIGSIRTNLIYY